MLQHFRTLLAGALLSSISQLACAQDFPTRPLRRRCPRRSLRPWRAPDRWLYAARPVPSGRHHGVLSGRGAGLALPHARRSARRAGDRLGAQRRADLRGGHDPAARARRAAPPPLRGAARARRLARLFTVWLGAALILVAGCLAGLALGSLGASLFGQIVERRTGLALPVMIGLPELLNIVGLIAIGSVMALLPALASFRTPVGDALRSV